MAFRDGKGQKKGKGVGDGQKVQAPDKIRQAYDREALEAKIQKERYRESRRRGRKHHIQGNKKGQVHP